MRERMGGEEAGGERGRVRGRWRVSMGKIEWERFAQCRECVYSACMFMHMHMYTHSTGRIHAKEALLVSKGFCFTCNVYR